LTFLFDDDYVTVMLRKYDIVKSLSLLAFAVAGGAVFAAPASAEVSCSSSAGATVSLTDYVTRTSACLNTAEGLVADAEDALAAEVNAAREALGLAPLKRRDGLDMAARVHALDMSGRDYLGHSDPEGRNHLFRIRAFDRSILVGDFGANVVKVPVRFSGREILNSMGQDDANAFNLIRETFTDMGVGVIEKDGALYVVVTFADVQGVLEEPVPLSPRRSQSLKADMDESLKPVTWALNDVVTGERLRLGHGSRLRTVRLTDQDLAGITITAEAGLTEVTLKGPMITGR
jgi:uncharacterized protein YkwD